MSSAGLSVMVRGDLAGLQKAEAQAMARIHTSIVRRAASRTAKGIQAQIRRGFDNRGKELVKTIRWKSDPPRGNSVDAQTRVYANARYGVSRGRRRVAFNLVDLYRSTETVLAASKQWLAIPTENAPWRAGQGGARKAQPSESGIKLRFVPISPFRAVLVQDKHGRGKGGRSVIMYVLVRQVRRRRRLDPDASDRESVARSTRDFETLWAREDASLRARFGATLSLAA